MENLMQMIERVSITTVAYATMYVGWDAIYNATNLLNSNTENLNTDYRKVILGTAMVALGAITANIKPKNSNPKPKGPTPFYVNRNKGSKIPTPSVNHLRGFTNKTPHIWND